MKRIVFLVVLLTLLLSAMAIPALAQYGWTVGVNVGDWFLYEGTLINYESDTVEFPPTYLQYLETYADSEWMNYTITDITDTLVTFEILTKWTNGSETTSILEEEIESMDGEGGGDENVKKDLGKAISIVKKLCAKNPALLKKIKTLVKFETVSL